MDANVATETLKTMETLHQVDLGASNAIGDALTLRNVQRFRGGLVFKAHRLCVSLNSRLESNKEEEVTLVA